jgi:hypothetical protein
MMEVALIERAERAAEFSPGWSEAEPRDRDNLETKGLFRRPCPGLRSARPGLNSAAGYAGSLRESVFDFKSFESSSGRFPKEVINSCLT